MRTIVFVRFTVDVVDVAAFVFAVAVLVDFHFPMEQNRSDLHELTPSSFSSAVLFLARWGS